MILKANKWSSSKQGCHLGCQNQQKSIPETPKVINPSIKKAHRALHRCGLSLDIGAEGGT